MTEKDVQIGRAVAQLRGDRPQQEVANLMRERGWKWSQATVWSVEKGERPLRLTEAEDLADILHVLVHDFTRGDAWASIRSAAGKMHDIDKLLRATVRHFLAAQAFLEMQLERARAEGIGNEMFEAWMEVSPESVVADVRFDLDQEERAHKARRARIVQKHGNEADDFGEDDGQHSEEA